MINFISKITQKRRAAALTRLLKKLGDFPGNEGIELASGYELLLRRKNTVPTECNICKAHSTDITKITVCDDCLTKLEAMLSQTDAQNDTSRKRNGVRKMITKSCFFTGHRKISVSRTDLSARLISEINKLIDLGVENFYAGGALGFDTIAAQAVLKCREDNPQIKLILALPCRDQTKSWNEKDVRTYHEIMDSADEIIYLADKYHSGCMHKRNRFMVDNAKYGICYLEAKTGGTAYTVRYAASKNRTIINLA